MSLAWVAVFASAGCAGTAAAVQSIAARRLPPARTFGPKLVGAMVRSPVYLLALAFLASGFVLSVIALRSLPLFAVQAGRASSLAVTAVLSVFLLRARLRMSEVLAILGIAVGLLFLAASAGPEQAKDVPTGHRLWMLVAVVAVGLGSAAIARYATGPRSGLALAVMSGLSFGLHALGARLIRGFTPLALVSDPAAWVAVLAGLIALVSSIIALQRTTVVTATAAMVAIETVSASLLGLAIAGDHPSAGSGWYAVVGFIITVLAALSLARFAAPVEEEFVEYELAKHPQRQDR